MNGIKKYLCFLWIISLCGCVSVRDREAYYSKIETLACIGNDRNTQLRQTDLAPFVVKHFTQREEGDSRHPKAIVINYDGCRTDMLAFLSPENSAVFSNAAQGGLYLMYTGGDRGAVQNTRTAPGFTTQFTGAWARGDTGHGVFNNGLIKKEEPRSHFICLAEKNFRTAFHFLWNAYRVILSPDIRYAQENNLPVEWNRTRLSGTERKNPDLALLEDVLERIGEEGDNEVDFLTCIFEETDLAGHHSGFSPDSQEYRDALMRCDLYASRVMTAIKNRTTYPQEDWLILISSDHGGLRLTHGGQSVYERTVWVSSNRKWE